MSSSSRSMKVRGRFAGLAAIGMALALTGGQVQGVGAIGAQLEFQTQLFSMNLTGGPFLMPLAFDPSNSLGDSEQGYGWVNSQVRISLSSQRASNPGLPSLGRAYAFESGPTFASILNGNGLPPIDPVALHGRPFSVDSFFDVFFDITVTDVDTRPGRDFAGQVDGAALVLSDNGPARMQSQYAAIFDKNAPNFGLVPPPEASPYLGHFNIEIPLGGDLNGNGEDDKIKFTFAAHAVGDQNRTFIILPDGTVIDNFDSAAYLEGLISDLSADPPFTIGQIDPDTGLPDPGVFGGPTTASSRLLNPVVPEPAGLGLMVLGLAGLAMSRRTRR